MRVTKVIAPEASGKVSVGDAIVSVDGVPVTEWLAAHPFESRALGPEFWLDQTADRIVLADLPFAARETWVRDAVAAARGMLRRRR